MARLAPPRWAAASTPLESQSKAPNPAASLEVLPFSGAAAAKDTAEVCPTFGLGPNGQVLGLGGWECRQAGICSVGKSFQCPTEPRCPTLRPGLRASHQYLGVCGEGPHVALGAHEVTRDAPEQVQQQMKQNKTQLSLPRL